MEKRPAGIKQSAAICTARKESQTNVSCYVSFGQREKNREGGSAGLAFYLFNSSSSCLPFFPKLTSTRVQLSHHNRKFSRPFSPFILSCVELIDILILESLIVQIYALWYSQVQPRNWLVVFWFHGELLILDLIG